jgi:CRP-like cAMP-binding protein
MSSGSGSACLRPVLASKAVASSTRSASGVRRSGPAPVFVLPSSVAGRARQEYEAGASVYNQGDPADAVFYVHSGRIKLTVASKRGKDAVISMVTEGSFFGEGCLAGQSRRVSMAWAVERSVLTRVPRDVMMRLHSQDPEFAQRFLSHLLARNIRLESDLVDHLLHSSEKRLARLLLLLANFDPQDPKPVPIITKIRQETIAEMIGTTRSRVSHFLHRFRKLGFIDYNDDGGMRIYSSLVSVLLEG